MNLIDKLDYVLQENEINSTFNDEPGLNVLIYGPEESEKNEWVKEWCNIHSNDFETYHILTNPEPHMLETTIDNKKVKYLFEQNEIDSFNKENTVLIIDHFDLSNKEVRNELMSLVKKKEVSSPVLADTKIKVDKFWFIVAIVYPESYSWHDSISKEDISSFDFVFRSVDFSSNAQTEEEYINDVVDDILSQIDEEDKQYYLKNPEYDHMGFGTWVRNEYLWNRIVPSDKNPDDLSPIIFDKLIETLKKDN